MLVRKSPQCSRFAEPSAHRSFKALSPIDAMTVSKHTVDLEPEPTDDPLPPVTRALPAGTWLDEFEVGEVIAEGSSSIVYAATDDTLAIPVAIAEYMPARFAQRVDPLQVVPQSAAHASIFAAGLRAFIDDARVLARCDHRSLVRILRLREANATAYRIMPRYTATTLSDVRQGMTEPPDEATLMAILDGLLGALEAFHRAARFHGKVTPSNILVMGDGRPMLLSPGSAGRVLAGDPIVALMSSTAPCFAPIEQLVESADMPLGPSVDLYALAGVVRYWITGQLPPPAFSAPGTARHETFWDVVQRLGSQWPQLNYHPALLDALDGAASIYPARRPQSVAEMRLRMEAVPAPRGRLQERAVPPAPTAAVRTAASPGLVTPPTTAVPQGTRASPTETTTQRIHGSTLTVGRSFDAANDLHIEPRTDAAAAVDVGDPHFVADPTTPDASAEGVAHDPVAMPPVVDLPLAPSETVRVEGDTFERPIGAPRPRRRGGAMMWGAIALALLIMAPIAVYYLNQHHKLDRVLDALGIPNAARTATDMPTPAAPASTAPVAAPPSASAAAHASPPSPVAKSTPAPTAALAGATPSSAQALTNAGAPSVESAASTATAAPQSSVSVPPSSVENPGDGAASTPAGSHNAASPREACGGRTEFALYRCMQTLCTQRQWTAHAQCDHLRATDRVD
jgi:serine/threonine protein kinase